MAVVPELPEVETVRRQIAPVLEGATIVDAEIVDPRLTRPVEPGLVAGALVGEQIAEVDRRGKYLLDQARERPHARRAPADDRLAPPRAVGRAPGGRAPPRDAPAGHGHRRRLPRRPALRDLGAPRRGPPAAVPRDPARPGAARRLVQRGEARAARRRADRARQVVPARPAAHRRDREHLRRRGALARPRASTPPGRRARRGGARAAAPRDPGGAPEGRRAPGLDAARVRHAERHARRDAAASSTSTAVTASRATAAAARSSAP